MNFKESEKELREWLLEQSRGVIIKSELDYVLGYLERVSGVSRIYYLEIVRSFGYTILKGKRSVVVKLVEDIERHGE